MATSRSTKSASPGTARTASAPGKGSQSSSPPGAALRKGTRITGTDRDALTTKIRKRYLSGESIRSVAADLGRSYGFVHRILVDADVTLRGRGGATRTKKE